MQRLALRTVSALSCVRKRGLCTLQAASVRPSRPAQRFRRQFVEQLAVVLRELAEVRETLVRGDLGDRTLVALRAAQVAARAIQAQAAQVGRRR